MSKIRLSGSNSGYVEIAAAADAGNLTFNMAEVSNIEPSLNLNTKTQPAE